MRLRFTRSARRHKVGKGHALHVMGAVNPRRVPATRERDERWVWVADDDRGIELEIVAVITETQMFVIHVMPTALRRRGQPT